MSRHRSADEHHPHNLSSQDFPEISSEAPRTPPELRIRARWELTAVLRTASITTNVTNRIPSVLTTCAIAFISCANPSSQPS